MSMINEALKKAGQPVIQSVHEKKSEIPLRPEIEFHRKRSRAPWGPLFVLGLLMLITGPVLLPLFQSPFQGADAGSARGSRVVSVGDEVSSAALRAPQGSQGLGQFAIEETPIQAVIPRPNIFSGSKSPLPKFSLSGIVYSEQGSYCLINGKVLKMGEKVSGATLETIHPNPITLDYLGEKIIIALTS